MKLYYIVFFIAVVFSVAMVWAAISIDTNTHHVEDSASVIDLSELERTLASSTAPETL